MADFGTTFPSRFADILAKYADADGAMVSAHIDAAGGESTSVNLSVSADVDKDGAQTSISANVEAETDGATMSASGDAAASGETASASLDLSTELQNNSAVAEVVAKAEATGDGADTTATASTDASVSPEPDIVDFWQETVETPGDNTLIVESSTSLEAFWNESFALDPLLALEESAPIMTGDVDWLF